MKNIFAIILLLVINTKLFSQVDTSDFIDNKLFQLIEEASENIEDVQFYDIIEELLQNPIDLNTATKNQLLKLPFLTPEEANRIIKDRKSRGGYNSLTELNTIKNLHPDIVVLIKPFVKISEVTKISKGQTKMNNFSFQLRSRLLSDIKDRAGFTKNNFMGNKLKSYNRLKVSFDNIRIGVLTEKDAGEKSYYDHYAGFMEYKSSKLLNKLIIGDYNFEFGQGLALWSPYAFSKGNESVNAPSKRERRFSPHLSSEENLHFRGAAVSFNYESYFINAFYSLNSIDASINDLDEITNLFISGYHRTDSKN